MLLLLVLAGLACAEPIRDGASAASLTWPPPDVWLLVDKSDHRMVVYSGPTAFAEVVVGLGEPVGDKVRQGDRKTPTGTFRVVTRNDQSSFHLFLGLSYPDAEDATRGLTDGLVSAAQAEAIRQADAAGRVPPWNTALGGAIGLHGGGGGADWTLGCVAMDDASIEALWVIAPMGTRVVIRE
jgi:murein L,D-transpeptidase YafK